MVEKLPAKTNERGEYLMAQMDLQRRMGELLAVAGSSKDSLEHLEMGVRAAREALQGHSGDVRFDQDAANVLTDYGHFLVTFGQDQAGLDAVKENYPVLMRMIADHPGDINFQSWLATDFSSQGRALSHIGDLKGSVDTYRKEIEFLEGVERHSPADALRRRLLMLAYSHLGDMLGNPQFANLGDFAGAIAAYEKMSAIAQSVAAADRENASAQLDAAMSAGRLGGLQLSRGEPAAALPPLQESVDGLQRLVERDAGNRNNVVYLCNNIELLGDAQEALGHLLDARTSYAREIALIAPRLEADQTNSSASATFLVGHLKLGLVLSQQGDPAGFEHVNVALREATRFQSAQPAEARLTLRLAICLAGRAVAGYRLAARPGADHQDASLPQARADLARAEELLASVPAEARNRVPAGNMSVIVEARRLLSANPEASTSH
jgi:tetratricopeptide (TPR) repeat protein